MRLTLNHVVSTQHLTAMINKIAEKEQSFRPESDLKAGASEQALADTRAELEELRSALAASRKNRQAARERKKAIAQEVRWLLADLLSCRLLLCKFLLWQSNAQQTL